MSNDELRGYIEKGVHKVWISEDGTVMQVLMRKEHNRTEDAWAVFVFEAHGIHGDTAKDVADRFLRLVDVAKLPNLMHIHPRHEVDQEEQRMKEHMEVGKWELVYPKNEEN